MKIRNRRLMIGVGSLLIAALVFGGGSGYWLGHSTAFAAGATPVATPTVTAIGAVPGPASLMESQKVLAELYNKVSPSVVNIQVTLQPSTQDQSGSSPFNFPFPFSDPNAPNQQAQPQMAEGSGFIFDDQGHIVTNNHVVADATSIVVNFSNDMWAKAELVARDPQADLAVIKVTPPKGMTLQPLPLASDNSLQVGYMVAAIGSPFDLAETLTTGIVSAIGRSFPTGDGTGPSYSLPDIIQTDAAINPGNSGGPLLDMNGDVVGINFAINSPVRANSGVGFTIPVSVVRKVVPALIANGKYDYSYLGLAGQTITSLVADAQKLPDNTLGVYVGDVTQDGPAAKAGIKANDVLTAIDSQPIHSFEGLLSYLFNNTKPEQKVTMNILRDGKEMQMDVVLGMRPSQAQQQADSTGSAFLSASKAITTAKKAVEDAGLMSTVDSTAASHGVVNGQPVWIVKLTGSGKSAVITIDAVSGEVLDLSVQK